MKKLFLVLLSALLLMGLACAAQEETVDDIVAKMTEANGGKNTLMAIQDRVGTWEMTMAMPSPESGEMTEMTSEMIITYKRPNMIRFDMQGPEGQLMPVSCYDGKTGWSNEMDPQTGAMQAKIMSEHEVKETVNMAATWIDGLSDYKERGTTITKMATEAGAEHIVLKCDYQNGYTETMYINPETYFVEKSIAMRMSPATQQPEELLMTLEDYKKVEGVAIPHVVALHTKDGATTLWTATFKEAKINTGVSEDLFTMNGMTAK